MKRAELYTLVWQNPTVHLAKRFGISNARLRKICSDYEIPLPPAGYWTKLAHGKAVERPELPQATPGIFGRINSALRQIGEIPLRLADAQIDEFDLKFSSVDEVDNAGVASPRLLPKSVQLEEALRRGGLDENGFVVLAESALPATKVGPESIDRVVLFFNSFLATLTEKGFGIHDVDSTFHISVDDELFDLKIYETRDRRPDDDSTRHGKTGARGEGDQVDFRPSGKLCMAIVDSRTFRWSNRNLVGQWHDRRGIPLEQCIPAAIAAVVKAAKLIKHCRILAQAQMKSAEEVLSRQLSETARLDRERRIEQYLRKKAADYTKYLELAKFAEFMLSLEELRSDRPSGRLARKLQRLVVEMRQRFTPQSLDLEIVRLGLFADDDPD